MENFSSLFYPPRDGSKNVMQKAQGKFSLLSSVVEEGERKVEDATEFSNPF